MELRRNSCMASRTDQGKFAYIIAKLVTKCCKWLQCLLFQSYLPTIIYWPGKLEVMTFKTWRDKWLPITRTRFQTRASTVPVWIQFNSPPGQVPVQGRREKLISRIIGNLPVSNVQRWPGQQQLMLPAGAETVKYDRTTEWSAQVTGARSNQA